MATPLEKKGLEHLERIEEELEELNSNTGNPRRSFVNGLFYGGGAFLGGVIAVILLGWFLSIIGVIPGFAELSEYVHAATEQIRK